MPDLLVIAYPDIDPIAIRIGPLGIRWYALAYLAGLLIGWRMMVRQVRLPGTVAMTRTQVDDFLVWAILGVILGGRLGYVIFYNPSQYLQDPLEIPQIWLGGMSFHGGLAGVAIAMAWFARRNNLPVLSLTDVAASVAPVGILFGRLANFVNGELWGRPTDAAWAVVFPGGGPEPRHPSQLYEAVLEGLLLLILVQWLYRSEAVRRRPGMVAGVFLAGYGAARLFVELFREPDAHIGFLAAGSTMGQWLTVPVVVLGIYLIGRARREAPSPSQPDNHLPGAFRATVDPSKVTAYLLSETHPVGRAKAAFFGQFGFSASNWEALRDALLAHARTGEVSSTAATEFGMKYIVDGPFSCPDGQTPRVRTVWFVTKGSAVPRLVTAHPIRGGDG